MWCACSNGERETTTDVVSGRRGSGCSEVEYEVCGRCDYEGRI